jgi:hypothetical protein
VKRCVVGRLADSAALLSEAISGRPAVLGQRLTKTFPVLCGAEGGC